jgi:hypothetical protein
MTEVERQVFEELANAYRILREAYYHDMRREEPPANALQVRVREILNAPKTHD